MIYIQPFELDLLIPLVLGPQPKLFFINLFELFRIFYLNFLFSVYGISWNQIFGGKNIFFTLGDENATASVWFDNHFGASSGTTTSTSSWTASTTSAAASTTTATSTAW